MWGEGRCTEVEGSLRVFVGRSLCRSNVFHEFTSTGPGWFRSPLGARAPCLGVTEQHHICHGLIVILFAEGRKRVSQVAQSLLNWNIIEIIAQKALHCFMRVAMRLLCNAGSWLLCLAFHKPGDLSEVNPFRTSSPGTSSLHSSSNNSCSLRAGWLGWPSCRSS